MAPTKDAPTTTGMEAPSSLHIKADRATPHPPVTARATSLSRLDSGKDPVASARESKVTSVKEKFRDVFNVSSTCERIDKGILDQFSDDVSVAGRLSRKSSIEFF